MGTPARLAISSSDVTSANKISDLGPQPDLDSPSRFSGISLVDNGPVCEGIYDEKCFMSSQQRTNLLPFWVGRVGQAYQNYSMAIAELRVDELLKKEENNEWLIALLLDVAGGQIISIIASQLVRVRADAISRLGGKAGEVISKNAKRAKAVLTSVSAKEINSSVKKIMDLGRKEYAKELMQDSDGIAEKSSNLAMLGYLQKQAGAGFEAIREQAPGELNDADFVVLFDSFKDDRHSVTGYKAALTEKLARFNASGVTKLGRRNDLRDVQLGKSQEAVKLDVIRDTRLVWLRYPDGRMELRFQIRDGEDIPGVAEFGDPGTEWAGRPPSFGPSNSLDDAPRLGDAVPAEFIEVALSRHVEAWKRPPLTVNAENMAASWFQRDRTSASPSTGPAVPDQKQPGSHLAAEPK